MACITAFIVAQQAVSWASQAQAAYQRVVEGAAQAAAVPPSSLLVWVAAWVSGPSSSLLALAQASKDQPRHAPGQRLSDSSASLSQQVQLQQGQPLQAASTVDAVVRVERSWPRLAQG